MKTIYFEEETIVAFHIGRGGRFWQPGHLSFIGEKTIGDFIDDLFWGVDENGDAIPDAELKKRSGCTFLALERQTRSRRCSHSFFSVLLCAEFCSRRGWFERVSSSRSLILLCAEVVARRSISCGWRCAGAIRRFLLLPGQVLLFGEGVAAAVALRSVTSLYLQPIWSCSPNRRLDALRYID